jgi:hypothetical protein
MYHGLDQQQRRFRSDRIDPEAGFACTVWQDYTSWHARMSSGFAVLTYANRTQMDDRSSARTTSRLIKSTDLYDYS